MKQLFFILLFFSVGIHAQTKKQKFEKMSQVGKKLYFKGAKKAQYGANKSLKDEQMKRIINLSQQNDSSRKEVVKKNTDHDKGAIMYEETSYLSYRRYHFIGLDSNKNVYPRDNRLVLRDI